MKYRNAVRRFGANVASAARSTAGKVGAVGTSLMASGAALASGGGDSPGAAIAGELASGKSEVNLVIAAVAVILGVIILWGYIKRAR